MTPLHVDEFGRIRDAMTRPVSFTSRRSGGIGGVRKRKYPAIAVGQVLGPWRVLAVFSNRPHGRPGLRAVAQCTCGREKECNDYDLRKSARRPDCQHRKGRR